jgi:hypothetical protein
MALDSDSGACREIQLEILRCTELMKTGAVGSFEAYQRLRNLLMGSTADKGPAASIEVCNKHLLNVYILLNRCGLIILEISKRTLDDESICKESVFFGILAASLILHYTKCPSLELVVVMQVLAETIQRGAVSLLADALSLETYVENAQRSFILCHDSRTSIYVSEFVSEIFSIKKPGEKSATFCYQSIAKYALEILKSCYGLRDARENAETLLNLLRN